MTKPPTKPRMTVGEWTGLISLAISLIGCAVEMRVQIATLRADVAAIRHDLDWLEKLKAHVEGPAKAPAAIGRQEVAALLPRLVQDFYLEGTKTPSIRATTAMPGMPGEGPDRTGDNRGSHYSPSRKLDALFRPRKSSVPVGTVPQQ